jgi:DNA repair exonuclease SbcCD nuclease subunit
MLRLVQTSDVHLGARHPFLGDRAGEQRARQLAAFERTVDLALSTPADLFLVGGDLFDSNVQPRASVERVVALLKKLVGAGMPVVLIPGDHDGPGRASIYHAFDLAGLVGDGPGAGAAIVLTEDAPDVDIPTIATRVTSRFPATGLPEEGWRIGLIHRERMPREDEIAASGVDYLAIGGPHSAAVGRAGSVSWAASGAPESVEVERDAAGEALLVTLDESASRPTVERLRVGKTRFEQLDLDLRPLRDQAGLVKTLTAQADPDLVLDVRLTGDRPDDVEVDLTAAETALAPRFLRLRIRDDARPTLTAGPLPPADTIAGAFLRDLEGRIAQAESAGDPASGAELREALRLGRRLLAGGAVER